MNTAASFILICLNFISLSLVDITSATTTTTPSTIIDIPATADNDANTTLSSSLDALKSMDSLVSDMFSLSPEIHERLNAFKSTLRTVTGSQAASTAGIMTPGTQNAQASTDLRPSSVPEVQSAANFNLGNNAQTTGLISQIVQTILGRILGDRGSTNSQPTPSNSLPHQSSGTGSTMNTSPFGNGNMFNPFGVFGNSPMNPFSMLWPSMLFDAIDFI